MSDYSHEDDERFNLENITWLKLVVIETISPSRGWGFQRSLDVGTNVSLTAPFTSTATAPLRKYIYIYILGVCVCIYIYIGIRIAGE